MTILESRVRTLTTTSHLSDLTTLSSGTLTCSISTSAVSVGLAWAASASISSARYHVTGNGSQNAAFITGGITTSAASPTGAQSPMSLQTVETFNGTEWFSRANLNSRRYQATSFGNYGSTIVTSGTNNAVLTQVIGGVSTDFTATIRNSEIHTITSNTWRSSADLNTDRRLAASCGTVNAGLVVSGYRVTSNTSSTEQFNGSVWSVGGATTARYGGSATGSLNAGLFFGGYITAVVATTQKYNGSSWSTTGSLATARHAQSGAGSGNYALAIAGFTTAGVTSCERFNVSVWSSSQATTIARYWTGGSGTQNKALVFGDNIVAEKYNGNSLLQIKVYSKHEEDNSNQSFSLKVFQESHIEVTTPPWSNLTEKTELEEIDLDHDDLLWSSGGVLTVARQSCSATGTYRTSLVFGGLTSLGALSLVTEKYNLNVITASANMLAGRWIKGCAGTQNATILFGGNNNTNARNETYSFNGTSWSTLTNLNTSREGVSGLGASLSALAIGGAEGGVSTIIFNSTEFYNGSSWSNSQNLNAVREFHKSTGSVGASLVVNGQITTGGTRTSGTEKYNGTSWTTDRKSVV